MVAVELERKVMTNLHQVDAAERTYGSLAWPVVVGNIVPLAGVLFFEWDAFNVVFLYWLESAVIGGFNLLKIVGAHASIGLNISDSQGLDLRGLVARTQGSMHEPASASEMPGHASLSALVGQPKLLLALFFIVHYGLFMFVHLVFIVVLLGGKLPGGFGVQGRLLSLDAPLEVLGNQMSISLGIALALVIFEHTLEFCRDFWLGGEYLRTSPAWQLFAPYARIFVMQVAILIGGMLVVFLSLPRMIAALLVVLKTVLECRRLPIALS